jgi:osmotically-inducible protein OsmY
VSGDVKPLNIDVTTSAGGVVELRGEVESAQAKTEAVRLARDVDGVTRVEDRLRVVAPRRNRRVRRTGTPHEKGMTLRTRG